MQEKRAIASPCGHLAYPAERNTPLLDRIVKKTDLEKLKGLKINNTLKRDGQRAGKPGQGANKATQQSKLLNKLLGKPAPEQDKP
jgi:hypothetical protein